MKSAMNLVLCIALAVGMVVAKGSAQDASKTVPIQQAIDYMLGGNNQKVDMQPRIDKVVSFGDKAVPFLISTYDKTKDLDSTPIVSSLCQIESDSSLSFVQKILREHSRQFAVIRAIDAYPVAREDEIITLLIDLLVEKDHEFWARERLEKMIKRKPSRAGVLVNAMALTDSSMTGRNLYIGDILAFFSGYSNTWCCFEPTGTDMGKWQHDFWNAWWNRNKDKDVFGWLIEPASSKNEYRQAEALQLMVQFHDKRAIPYFLSALDSSSSRVQCLGIFGLLDLDRTIHEPMTYDDVTKNKETLIPLVKEKFKGAVTSQPATKPTAQ